MSPCTKGLITFLSPFHSHPNKVVQRSLLAIEIFQHPPHPLQHLPSLPPQDTLPEKPIPPPPVPPLTPIPHISKCNFTFLYFVYPKHVGLSYLLQFILNALKKKTHLQSCIWLDIRRSFLPTLSSSHVDTTIKLYSEVAAQFPKRVTQSRTQITGSKVFPCALFQHPPTNTDLLSQSSLVSNPNKALHGFAIYLL